MDNHIPPELQKKILSKFEEDPFEDYEEPRLRLFWPFLLSGLFWIPVTLAIFTAFK